jgi:3-hydroxy-3-methylglutaryl CoA synthase
MTEKTQIHNKPLFLSIRYSQGLDKLLVFSYQLIEKYFEHIFLQTYGSGVKSIRFTFVCMTHQTQNHQEKTLFSQKDKELYIVRQLDYGVFSQLSLDNALKMQANVFLQALNKVRKRKKTIPDFDFERFYADVENLFREKGWIENEKSF